VIYKRRRVNPYYNAVARVLRDAARATIVDLTQNQPWQQTVVETVDFHIGDDPIQADKVAQTVFAATVYAHPDCSELRIVAVVGEEEAKYLVTPDIGDRVIVVDPLDGSKPWAMARIGYCVAAICLLLVAKDTWAIEGAILATTTDVFTLRGDRDLSYGLLYREPDSDVSLQSTTPENDNFPPSLATVAYKPDDRARCYPIFARLPEWSIITLGGNPLTPYVITAALTAVLTTKKSTTWDTIGVLMASATDAIVGTIDGQILGGDFRQLFAQVALSGPNASNIPELVVAKTLARYLEIVDAIRESGYDPAVNNEVR
jgi:hypothetical protein